MWWALQFGLSDDPVSGGLLGVAFLHSNALQDMPWGRSTWPNIKHTHIHSNQLTSQNGKDFLATMITTSELPAHHNHQNWKCHRDIMGPEGIWICTPLSYLRRNGQASRTQSATSTNLTPAEENGGKVHVMRWSKAAVSSLVRYMCACTCMANK